MPHDHCPPSRRGHSWRDLSCKIPPSEGGPTIRDLALGRVCARCGALGRVTKQGTIVVMTTAEIKNNVLDQEVVK